ncbi:hypothetical protein DFA_00969 [Cavenderia fasciculata]|uniref:Ankyrin repeat-containing protein n=1 Tax=Cavenderia fasciculata TaxID=261658 RepID=F4PUS5_CACFS|nr:uncharacterized protein DFA_00969 [Cavenderia fasciculata]EGG21094.1 hypothetical protein DFA_00969 [Cavenderia fasciculata]|eukprot:XP_004358944.1 hypothetical protein DFA_00969 [Cavenderia fasciculata]
MVSISTTITTTNQQQQQEKKKLIVKKNIYDSKYGALSLIINNVYLFRIITRYIVDLNKQTISDAIVRVKEVHVNPMYGRQKPISTTNVCAKKFNEINISWCVYNNMYNVLKYKIKHLTIDQNNNNNNTDLLEKELGKLSASMIKPLVSNLDLPSLTILYRSNTDLFERSCYLVDIAAQSNNLDTVKFFHQVAKTSDYELATRSALHLACCNGSLEIVKFLHTHRSEGCNIYSMNMAAKAGHIDIVMFLHFNRTEGCNQEAMDGAASSGFLNIVEFLHTNRAIEGCTTAAMNGAARNGSLDVVAYLHQHRNEGATHEAIDGAARNGHMDVVLYLLKHRGEGYSHQAFSGALENNHPAIFKTLLYYSNLYYKKSTSQHFFDNLLVDSIKLGSRQEIAKILIEGKHARDLVNIVDEAVTHNRLDMLAFLLDHPQTCQQMSPKCLQIASSKGYLPIVQLLIEKRPTQLYPHVPLALSSSIANGHSPVSSFLASILNKIQETSRSGTSNSNSHTLDPSITDGLALNLISDWVIRNSASND